MKKAKYVCPACNSDNINYEAAKEEPHTPICNQCGNLVIPKLKQRKCKHRNNNDYCRDGRNEFDGLCSIEACELSELGKILKFGLKNYLSFKKYVEKSYQVDINEYKKK